MKNDHITLKCLQLCSSRSLRRVPLVENNAGGKLGAAPPDNARAENHRRAPRLRDYCEFSNQNPRTDRRQTEVMRKRSNHQSKSDSHEPKKIWVTIPGSCERRGSRLISTVIIWTRCGAIHRRTWLFLDYGEREREREARGGTETITFISWRAASCGYWVMTQYGIRQVIVVSSKWVMGVPWTQR